MSSEKTILRWFSAGSATNYNMLLFRTMNRELGQPNANADGLASVLLSRLMPARLWWLKRVPGAMKRFAQGLESRRFGVPGVLNFVDARTSWFDNVVNEALSKHGINQVVVVAAGFDTRAYRIGAKHKGVSFFEVDLPHASAKKQELVNELLQPETTFPRPTFLAADLSTQPLDALLLSTTTSSGAAAASATTSTTPPATATPFDPTQPTLFTVEGLIYYLPTPAVTELFASMLRVTAPGSRVAFDFLHKEVLDGSVPPPPAYKVTAASVANKGEPFISGMHNSREGVQEALDAAAMAAGLSNSKAEATAAAGAGAETGTGADMAAAAAAGAGAGAGAGGVDGGSNGASVGSSVMWRVTDFLGPREMVAQQLPHLTYDDALPPILSFYSFATAEVVPVAAAE